MLAATQAWLVIDSQLANPVKIGLYCFLILCNTNRANFMELYCTNKSSTKRLIRAPDITQRDAVQIHC